MEIIKKAYKVWVDGDEFNDYPFFGNPDDLDCVFADTHGQAKQCCDFEYDLYIDIRVRRSKGDDRVMYKGYQTSRDNVIYQLKSEKIKTDRTKRLKKFPKDSLFYVQRGYQGFVGNSVYLWGVNGNGYTINPDKAHKYSLDEVVEKFINNGSDEIFWESKHFESKISKHVDSQHLDHSFKI